MVNNNGDDGKISKDKSMEDESKTIEQTEKQAQANPTEAFIGVDGEGYFFCKIHMSNHPWMILGFLQDAISQYRGIILKRQKEIEEQRKKLMGGSRRFFNLLKP